MRGRTFTPPRLAAAAALALALIRAPAAQAQATPDPSSPAPALTSVPANPAAPPPVSEGASDEDVIVVTARRSEERLGRAAVAVEVISRAQITTSGARDVAQALQNQTGVQIDGGFQGQSLRLFGLDPQHTLILIDGERVVGALDGAIDLTRFLAQELERIEIVRGPASALYGSDAMAGVINIITRLPREGFSMEGMGVFGATRGPDGSFFDLGKHGDAWLNVGGGVKKLRARASFGYRHEAAFDLTPSTLATTGNESDVYQASTKVDYLPSARVRVPLAARLQRRDQYGIDESGSGAVYDRTTRAEDLAVQLAPRWKLRSDDQLTATSAYSLVRRQYLRDQRGDTEGDVLEDSREHLGTLRGQYDAHLGSALVLTGGLELIGHRFESPRLAKEGQRGRVSPYLQGEWTVTDNPRVRAVLLPSARVDVDSQYGTNVSPRMATRVDPWEGLVLRAAVGRGFRAPSFTELLLSFDNPSVGYRVRGNEALEPETSIGANVSAELSSDTWSTVTLNLFRNDLRDMIDTRLTQVVAGEQIFEYVNVKRARTQGAEVSWLVHPIRQVDLEANYTLTHTRDLENDRPLPGRSLHRGALRASYAGKDQPLSLSLRAVISGKSQFYVDDEKVPVDRLLTLDARAAYRIGKYVEPFVRGDNLTNAGGVNQPLRPLSVYVGVTIAN